MSTLKMTEDKTLTITKAGNTYEDENNAEVIKILLPRQINGNDLHDCVIHLCVLNQENLGDEINISKCLQDYGNNLYIANIDVTNQITYKAGQIQLWIKVLNSDNEMVAKTNPVTYQIKEHLDIEDYIPEQKLSILDNFSIRMEQSLKKTEGLIEDIEDIKEKVNNGEFQNGESAYEIAVRNGYKGTEQEWLETLHGGDAILRYNSENKSIEFSHSKSEDWKYLFSLSEIVDEVTANDIIAAIEEELQAVQRKAQEVYNNALEASEEIAGYVVEAQAAKTNAKANAESAAASAQGAERYSQNAMNAAAVAGSSATEAKQAVAEVKEFADKVNEIHTELKGKADKAEVFEMSSVEFGWTEYPYTLQYNDEFSAQDFKNGYSDSCIEIGMPNTATINCKGSVLGFTVEITGSSGYSLSINGNEVLKGELGETELKSYTLPPTLINENKIVLSGSSTKFVFGDMKLYEGEAKIKGLGALKDEVANTYSKPEIDNMIGNIEALLGGI